MVTDAEIGGKTVVFEFKVLYTFTADSDLIDQVLVVI